MTDLVTDMENGRSCSENGGLGRRNKVARREASQKGTSLV